MPLTCKMSTFASADPSTCQYCFSYQVCRHACMHACMHAQISKCQQQYLLLRAFACLPHHACWQFMSLYSYTVIKEIRWNNSIQVKA